LGKNLDKQPGHKGGWGNKLGKEKYVQDGIV